SFARPAAGKTTRTSPPCAPGATSRASTAGASASPRPPVACAGISGGASSRSTAARCCSLQPHAMTGAELVEDAIAELREEPLQVPFVSHFPTSDTSAHLDGWLLALVRQQRVELAEGLRFAITPLGVEVHRQRLEGRQTLVTRIRLGPLEAGPTLEGLEGRLQPLGVGVEDALALRSVGAAEELDGRRELHDGGPGSVRREVRFDRLGGGAHLVRGA